MISRRRIRNLPRSWGEPIAGPVARERATSRFAADSAIEPRGHLLRCISLHLTHSGPAAQEKVQRSKVIDSGNGHFGTGRRCPALLRLPTRELDDHSPTSPAQATLVRVRRQATTLLYQRGRGLTRCERYFLRIKSRDNGLPHRCHEGLKVAISRTRGEFVHRTCPWWADRTAGIT
jgi:hypothetical protein